MLIHKPTKSVVEYCGKMNGLPSIVLFSHDKGVRFGYVGVRGGYAEETAQCFNYEFPGNDYVPNETEILALLGKKDMPMFCNYGADDFLDKTYSVVTSTHSVGRNGFLWVGYDCGHVGETYDKNAIQQYYPDEADNLIKKLSLIYTNSSPPVVRSLEWCKEKNSELARVMYNTQYAYLSDANFLEKAVHPKIETVSDKFIIRNGISLIKYVGDESDVIIPNGIKIIETNSFRDCLTVKSVTFPDSLKRIEDAAFVGCANLERLNNVNGDILLGDFAFADCEKLGLHRKDEELDLTEKNNRGRS